MQRGYLLCVELEQEQYEDIDNFQPQHQKIVHSGAAVENCRYPHIVLVPAPQISPQSREDEMPKYRLVSDTLTKNNSLKYPIVT